MVNTIDAALRVMTIGMGATLVMDVWAAVLRQVGVPSLDLGLLGRWVGHVFHGRWQHASISRAAPVPHEAWIGWTAHYAIGMAFAGILVATNGLEWLRTPSIVPALVVGLATVVAPLFILQPGMGAGIASRRTSRPVFNATKSVVTHAVFGLGMYLTALAMASLLPVGR